MAANATKLNFVTKLCFSMPELPQISRNGPPYAKSYV